MISFKYYKPQALITLISILAIVLYLTRHHFELSFSIFSVIGLLVYALNQWLWKYKPFSFLFWIENFSGRYEGELEYEYRDENCNVKKGTLTHVKIIHQTGNNISVFSFTKTTEGKPSSLSENKGMYVEKMNDDHHFQLIYNYLNGGNNTLGFAPHYGTDIIKFIVAGKSRTISGRYFTERLPYQTRGTYINLKKVSNNLKHDF